MFLTQHLTGAPKDNRVSEKTDRRTVVVFRALAATPNPSSFASTEFRLPGNANIRYTEE
jgi:hypothetical protein